MKVRNGYLDLLGKDWDGSFADVYTERGCDGVLVGSMSGPAPDDLEFLRRIPSLRGVSVFGPVRDCSVIASLPDLEKLHLPDTYSGPLPLAGLRLTALTVPCPRDLDDIAELVTLHELFITGWPKTQTSLGLLGDKPNLTQLRIEFVRTAVVSAAGLHAPALEQLLLYDGRLIDPEHLVDSPELRELRFYNTKIDSLDVVRNLPKLRALTVDNGGDIAGLEPLRDHPALVEVGFSGRTTMTDGDLTPLLNLPAAKYVALERGAPHYSHRPADVRR